MTMADMIHPEFMLSTRVPGDLSFNPAGCFRPQSLGLCQKLQQNKSQGSQALLAIDHEYAAPHCISHISVQVIPGIARVDVFLVGLKLGVFLIGLVKVIKNVIKQAPDGFFRPFVVALVEVDVINGS